MPQSAKKWGKKRSKQGNSKGSLGWRQDATVVRPSKAPSFLNALGSVTVERTELFVSLAYTGTVILNSLNYGSGSWPSSLQTFGANFDYYRVNRVKTSFVPRWFDAPGLQLPNLAIGANYDDFAAPGSVDAVLAKAGARLCKQWKTSQSYSITPCALMSVSINAGAGVSSKGLLGSPLWFNTAALAANPVDLAGMSYGITAVSAAPANGAFEIWHTWNITFRQPLM